ncbi:hypothetical protein [Azohydromonas caseinilytica]|uniref:Uncharacterized protein n=1 Tax=Azohydromonas caseinilytica TaxID=2728836 RepID=A0A848FDV3_9BURK|nr:hypothetical protein [Azohydromonas caseinilytica]NML16071.1 hypothetical protein [Azohydromonas caseinilytica]
MATANPNDSSGDAGVPERHPAGSDEVGQLNPVTPDAVSPEVRTDGDGPVLGGGSRDTGAGTVGGRDSSGPGGREPLRRPGVDEVRGAVGSDQGD